MYSKSLNLLFCGIIVAIVSNVSTKTLDKLPNIVDVDDKLVLINSENDDLEFDHIQDHPGLWHISTLEQMEEIGVNTSNVDLDLLNEAFMTTPELIKKHGYEVEIHTITSTDGYILELHRIPGPPGSQPVYLQHGILDTSASWILMRPGNGLGYLLSDLGYDVWMGNVRGNRYSRKHISLDPDGRRSQRKRFWEFSWHEHGVIDIPNMIDYVLNVTKFEKLHYIGHSQGTTGFFVMASERPEYNDKILSMHAFAPIAYMSNARSPFVRSAAFFLNTLDTATSVMGMYEFLPTNDLLTMGGQMACRDEATTQFVCTNVVFLICGYNTDQLNTTMLPVIMGHLPAGSSTNQFIHYGQSFRNGRFRQFDWGRITNLAAYGSIRPPQYKLENIRAPVALHYSSNDWLAEPVDVEELHKRLPNVIGKFLVPDPKFNHLDYMYAIDVKTLLFDRVFNIMRLVEKGLLPL